MSMTGKIHFRDPGRPIAGIPFAQGARGDIYAHQSRQFRKVRKVLGNRTEREGGFGGQTTTVALLRGLFPEPVSTLRCLTSASMWFCDVMAKLSFGLRGGLGSPCRPLR
jgi:hypothetical protein